MREPRRVRSLALVARVARVVHLRIAELDQLDGLVDGHGANLSTGRCFVKTNYCSAWGALRGRASRRVDMQTVVVTGASTGIGRATAGVLASNGFRVFGSVRRRADADDLSRALGPRFVPLIFDVTNRDA